MAYTYTMYQINTCQQMSYYVEEKQYTVAHMSDAHLQSVLCNLHPVAFLQMNYPGPEMESVWNITRGFQKDAKSPQ